MPRANHNAKEIARGLELGGYKKLIEVIFCVRRIRD